MWNARTEFVPGGIQFRVDRNSSPLSFRDLFDLLENDASFARWYRDTLADCGLEAFFWEHPPLTTTNFDHEAEFVLIGSSSLAQLTADPTPFASQFARHPGEDVITFPNLGADALLVVPCPIAPIRVYPHLAAFVRAAPTPQVLALWRAVGRLARENLSVSPQWLSTAGLGVAWLHLRLDTRPKYYRFDAYRVRG